MTVSQSTQLEKLTDLPCPKLSNEILQAGGIAAIHAVTAVALKRLNLPCGALILGLGIGSSAGYLGCGLVRRIRPLQSLLKAGISSLNQDLARSTERRRLFLGIGAVVSLVFPYIGFFIGLGLGLFTGLCMEHHQFQALGRC